jgi:hypothetical protein
MAHLVSRKEQKTDNTAKVRRAEKSPPMRTSAASSLQLPPMQADSAHANLCDQELQSRAGGRFLIQTRKPLVATAIARSIRPRLTKSTRGVSGGGQEGSNLDHAYSNPQNCSAQVHGGTNQLEINAERPTEIARRRTVFT